MQGEVTQENLHIFLPGKIAGVAAMMARDSGCSVLEAMKGFYASRTCKLLEREATKYWHYSPAQLYFVMREEEAAALRGEEVVAGQKLQNPFFSR